MAGCGQCPDTCNCVIADGNGNIYAGAGTPTDPIIVPQNATAWEGESDDGSIIITPGDVVPLSGDGHAPNLAVNWCAALDCATERDSGSILICPTEDDIELDDCKPKSLRAPVEGEFIGKNPDTGDWGPVFGAMSARALLTGMMIPWLGLTPNLPAGYLFANGSLVMQADWPELFTMFGHAYNGGVDPGGGQFRLPDLRGRAPFGFDTMDTAGAGRLTGATNPGDAGGVQDVTLGVTQIPSHSHTATDAGHTHTATSPAHNHAITDPGHDHGGLTGNHLHQPGSANRVFVTVEGTVSNVGFAAGAAGSVSQSVDNTQKTNANTTNEQASIASDVTGISLTGTAAVVTVNSGVANISVGSTGGGLAHTNMPPWLACNWIIVAA